MKAIVLAIVSLSVSAALANPPAKTTAPAATTTTTTTTDAAVVHGSMAGMADGHAAKMEDKCAGKTGKDMETCMKDMKKAKK